MYGYEDFGLVRLFKAMKVQMGLRFVDFLFKTKNGLFFFPAKLCRHFFL